MENQTTVNEFILLGLSTDPLLQTLMFMVFLVIYLITLVGNLVIMWVIKADPKLHTPMYFFLFHLSFVDICYSSTVVPKVLVNFSVATKTISVNVCITQMFFILLAGCSEVFILSAMAYDRYTAICDPLHYIETMSKQVCSQLVGGAWTVGCLYSLLNTLSVLNLHFCGPNEINHFSCEIPPLLVLSCSETFFNQVVLLTSTMILGSNSFLFILVSYIYIISTILRMHSKEGRRKAFSTCSSHLIVIGLYYLAAFCHYAKPISSTSLLGLDKLVSIQYSILTPMLNPIIYTLKNKEVKTALGKMLREIIFFSRG
ncbi:olfactory receptor 5A1-like [Dermochelys coriacea]|uniref:olfactory receptor 5A1-like n=1 Tax=Dermochelys coriacea TaxID=27794 RepID=UPI0018E8DFD1|nr:olfactory receptor 5A1-like [Dermochelys coriacea]